MPEEQCESYGASGLSGPAIGAVPVAVAGMAATLHLNNNISTINSAVERGMQSRAVSAAALAARKPGDIGAPIAPAPAAPMIAPAAAPTMALVPATAAAQQPQAQIGAHIRVKADPNARLMAKLATHTVPFCLVKEMSLSELLTGKVSAKSMFTVPLPKMVNGTRVVLSKVTVTRVQSTSRQLLGVRLGGLPAATMVSVPGRNVTTAFHVVLPTMDQSPCTKAQTVFALTETVNPDHVVAYSRFTRLEDLMAQVQKGRSGNYEVPLDSAIGYVLVKNAEKTSGAVVHEAADGSKYIIAPPAPVEAIAQDIHKKFIANQEFQRLLLKSDQFELEVVALNESGKFGDVPELNVEDAETQQRELQRRFRVLVMGHLEVHAVSAE